MNQRVNKRLSADISWAVWERCSPYWNREGGYQSMRDFLEDAMAAHAKRLHERGLPFKIAYQRHTGGEWPHPQVIAACYGIPWDSARKRMGTILSEDLREAMSTGEWNARVAPLIREHILQLRDTGVALKDPPLLPPGWEPLPPYTPPPRFKETPIVPGEDHDIY